MRLGIIVKIMIKVIFLQVSRRIKGKGYKKEESYTMLREMNLARSTVLS